MSQLLDYILISWIKKIKKRFILVQYTFAWLLSPDCSTLTYNYIYLLIFHLAHVAFPTVLILVPCQPHCEQNRTAKWSHHFTHQTQSGKKWPHPLVNQPPNTVNWLITTCYTVCPVHHPPGPFTPFKEKANMGLSVSAASVFTHVCVFVCVCVCECIHAICCSNAHQQWIL